MFSIPKLLVLALIVLAVVYGFKAVGSLNQRRAKNDPAKQPEPAKQRQRDRLEAEDLVQCPECGAYVAVGGDHECRRQA